MKEFDYYIFVDYSEHLIGYLMLNSFKTNECLEKISKLKHYRELKKRKLYIKHVKARFARDGILNCFLKKKIRNVIDTAEIFNDIAEFLKNNSSARIFISVDNRQYSNFEKFVKIIDGKNVKIVKESELKKGSILFRINLVLDTWLNMERLK